MEVFVTQQRTGPSLNRRHNSRPRADKEGRMYGRGHGNYGRQMAERGQTLDTPCLDLVLPQ